MTAVGASMVCQVLCCGDGGHASKIEEVVPRLLDEIVRVFLEQAPVDFRRRPPVERVYLHQFE
jgi:hypothetical protein